MSLSASRNLPILQFILKSPPESESESGSQKRSEPQSQSARHKTPTPTTPPPYPNRPQASTTKWQPQQRKNHLVSTNFSRQILSLPKHGRLPRQWCRCAPRQKVEFSSVCHIVLSFFLLVYTTVTVTQIINTPQ